MDKIKQKLESVVNFLRQEKISKMSSIVAFAMVFGRMLLQYFQNPLGGVSTSSVPEIFATTLELMKQPIFIFIFAIITALIVWGIFEGITGGFYNMFSPRGLTVGTKNEFKGIARFAFILIELLLIIFRCFYYIPKSGPMLVVGAQRLVQIILYTLFFTLTYILLEDRSIIRAHIADAYFPLQRLYKIYYGLMIGLGAISTIVDWREGNLSVFTKIIFFVEIIVVGSYFVLVPRFMQFLKKRQDEAKQFRNLAFSDSSNIKEVLDNMGIQLGESYEIYNPSNESSTISKMPTKDDVVITVEPDDVSSFDNNISKNENDLDESANNGSSTITSVDYDDDNKD